MKIIDKIKPKFTFVSFDGVVPLAKMKQQKQRRYKSYITKQILNKKNWNTNAITPGTKFMNDLDDYLSSRFKDNILFNIKAECVNKLHFHSNMTGVLSQRIASCNKGSETF